MEARVAGLVVEIRTRQTKQGKTMGFATIDDRTGRLEISLFGDKYETYRNIFTRDALLVAEGALAIDDFSGNLRLNAETLYSMEQARESFARGLQISWMAERENNVTYCFINELKNSLQAFKGGNCPVGISYISPEASVNLQLGEGWRVHPTNELLTRLKRLSGVGDVEVKYRLQ
jgi:DNA polymerase III subunit alpha